VAGHKNDLPVLYSFCNSFFVHDVYGEYGLLNVRFFDIFPAIFSISFRFFLSGEW